MFTWGIAARGTSLSVLLGAALAVARPASREQAQTAEAPVDTTAAFEMPKGTEVSGEVSGVWRRGPYIVTDVVTVPAGDTLIIEAGSSIYFMGPKDRSKLNINSLGYLDVVGTDSLPIVMASALPVSDSSRTWGGILYVGSFAEGRVEHVTFRNTEIAVQVRRGILADRPPAGGDTSRGVPEYVLRRATGPVAIRFCTIDSASFNGVVLVGVDSTVVVEDNLIRYCTSGISCEDSARPVIRNNRIVNNTSTGIICTGSSYPAIIGNTIVGSATAGIICANGSNPIVDLCVIARCGIGISATKSAPQISRCTIAKNDFSGIIAYEGAAPTVSNSNVRGNGLAGIDNRSSGNIRADRCWWGYIPTEARPAPVLDGGVRRKKGGEAPAEQTGRVLVSNSITSPSQEAPGTPRQAESLTLARDGQMSRPFTGGEATVMNGDTIYVRMVARDEDRYLEDEASIILSTTTGNPEGIQRVLTEQGDSTGIYQGYVVASLAAGDPNIVMQVRNGDLIKVETVTIPPLRAQVTFVSKPPVAQYLRINGQHRGTRLTDPRPVFSWRYWDNKNDPQTGTEIQLGTNPAWGGEPIWTYQEAGQRSSYTYDGPALVRGQTYYLRVRANDGYTRGRWTESYFRTNTAPPTPEPAYPANGAVLAARDQKPAVALHNVVDPDGDEVGYIFEAYYGQDFSNARMRVGGETILPPVPADANSNVTIWRNIPQLIENTRLWWRAKATDGLEESDWSEPWSFTLNTVDDPPQPFDLLEPKRDSTAATIQPRLEWGFSYDPDPGQDIAFVLTFGTDSLLQKGAHVREVKPLPEAIQYYQVPPTDTLLDNTDYYWTVSVKESDGIVLKANTDLRDTTTIWRFFVDTGNDPPRIAPIPSLTMREDTPQSLGVIQYVHDPDNPVDRLTLEARSTPHIAVEVGPRMQLSLTPEHDWYGGPETLNLTVTDPGALSASGTVQVTVNPVNDPPLLRAIPPVTFDEDGSARVTLTDYVTDPDNTPQQMRWSFSGGTNVRVNVANGVATFTAAKDWSGPETLNLTVTDPGGLSATGAIRVTVNPANDPPEARDIPDITMAPGDERTMDLSPYASDPDGDALTWEVRSQTGALPVSISGSTLRVSALAGSSGTSIITLVVRDGAGAEATTRVRVNIQASQSPGN